MLVGSEMVEALRAGDEAAFRSLVEQHHGSMLRLARAYTGDTAVAEEVVQESWLAALRGLDRFEGRSSLRTWLFGIVINQARSHWAREHRTVPLSSLGDPEPAVSPDRWRSPGEPLAGWWRTYPSAWDDVPADRLLAAEARAVVENAIAGLPPTPRAVITLRDVEGMTAAEVCSVLDISETNQRVALHRARSRVRRALEAYLTEDVER